MKFYFFILNTETKIIFINFLQCPLLIEQKPAHKYTSDLSYTLLYLQMTSRTMTS